MLLYYSLCLAGPVVKADTAGRVVCSASVSYFLNFNDSCQTNYLKIYRTDFLQ